MYLDTDVILALIKEEDWLKGVVDRERLVRAKTSVITVIEVQLIYYEKGTREFLRGVQSMIRDEGVEVLSLTPEVVQRSSELLEKYERLNVFDSLHLAHSLLLEEPVISTDTLYPKIEEVESIDPRRL